MTTARHLYRGYGPAGGRLQPRAWLGQLPSGFLVLGLSLLGLAACAMDKEAAVRAQLNNWLVLEDTQYFKSKRDCTAGLFTIGAKQIMSSVTKVHSTSLGLRLIGQGRAVAFDMADSTPAQVQEEIDKSDHSVGLAMLVSGLSAQTCFTPALETTFSDTLHTAGVVLIYDPGNHALALFEGARKQVFYTRGEL